MLSPPSGWGTRVPSHPFRATPGISPHPNDVSPGGSQGPSPTGRSWWRLTAELLPTKTYNVRVCPAHIHHPRGD